MSEPAAPQKNSIVLERTYRADLEDVWEMWTTKEGIESWWGPGGFAVTVQRLDLRVGGQLLYTMTAVEKEQIEYMKRSGMPTSHEALVTFREIVAPRRLRYDNLINFVPGVAPYDAGTLVELEARGDEVHLKLTIEAMHDDEWTQRAAAGWEQELGKLGPALARR